MQIGVFGDEAEHGLGGRVGFPHHEPNHDGDMTAVRNLLENSGDAMLGQAVGEFLDFSSQAG